MALDTLGVLLECYSRYPARFREPEQVSLDRRTRLLGLILSCLANYREQVRQEAMLVHRPACISAQRRCQSGIKNDLFSFAPKSFFFY